MTVTSGDGASCLVGRVDSPFARFEGVDKRCGGRRGVLGWSAMSGLVAMAVVVPDDQEGAAGCDPVLQALVEVELAGGGVGVAGDDEIEAGCRLPDGEVFEPVDPFCGRVAAAAVAGLVEGVRADVGRDDLPARLCQPRRFGARATACVECSPRHHGRELAFEVRVRQVRVVALLVRGPVSLPVVPVERVVSGVGMATALLVVRVGEVRGDHGAGAAAGSGGVEHLL